MLAARADFLSCGLEGPEYLVLHSSSGFLFLGQLWQGRPQQDPTSLAMASKVSRAPCTCDILLSTV